MGEYFADRKYSKRKVERVRTRYIDSVEENHMDIV